MPPAKRPSARPDFEEPAGIGLMTHEELVKEFCRMRKRYKQDVAWHSENTGVLADHADKLDQCLGIFGVLGKEAERQSKRMDATQKIIQDNDDRSKAELAANDEVTKTAIATVNTKVETAVQGLEEAAAKVVTEVNR